MSNLRRVPTSKLLVLCATVLAVLVLGVAIANAIATSGSPPPRTTLPRAIHGALTAPAPVGVSARIKFTSKLVDSSLLGEHASPLLTGASGRLWAAQGGRIRLELQSDRGDTQLVSDGHRFLFSDPSSNTVYTGALPAHGQKREKKHAEHKPSLGEIQKGLGRLGRFATVIGPGREVVGGRSAYSVRVDPKHNSGLFGGIGAAWDAIRGVPLRLAVYARGVKAPVLELEATDISYGPVPASTFKVSPPAHSRLHRVALASSSGHRERRRGARHKHAEAQGVAAVGKALPFHLSAPADIAGLHRTGVHLIGARKGQGAAGVVYGRPLLGGLVVIEHKVDKKSAKGGGLPQNLPKVRIGNVDGTELSTALGTLVSFERGGVDYTVVGPVGKAKAEEAARGL
jgi:outer membrane lipoprotein-sorting protein